jgi:Na+-transporting methylmalonyl-CoA/oxaloacetate decarboxylase gamma subunit
MYCSSCGVVAIQGLSYCNYCGAKLSGVQGDNTSKSQELRPAALVWAMVAVLIFGFVGIVFLMMAMKMAGLEGGPMLAFTTLSFLIMLVVEGVFISQLLRRKRGAAATDNPALSKGQATKELDAAQARVLPEPVASVTEHTTRTLEPRYGERKSR